MAGAIGLARPQHMLTITLVGDDWSIIQKRLNRFRNRMRVGGREWQDVVHVEVNPKGTGCHIHSWQWGDGCEGWEVGEAAKRAGFGSVEYFEERTAPAGAPLDYGLKTITRAPNWGQAVPESILDFLARNGGRLGHASRGFWRDAHGNQLAGIKEAKRVAGSGRAGDWIMLRESPGIAPARQGVGDASVVATVGAHQRR